MDRREISLELIYRIYIDQWSHQTNIKNEIYQLRRVLFYVLSSESFTSI